MTDCIIIVPTYSQYMDVCKIFFQLFKRNWSDCPYKIVLAIIGDDFDIDGIDKIYVGKAGRLTDCIVAVRQRYVASYYLSMLGDALICSRINTEEVIKLFNKLQNDNIKYCKIRCKKNRKNLYRNIKRGEAYVYTFIAFIANVDFIDEELKGISDYDFEMKYYKQVLDDKFDDTYVRILMKDIFHIVPAVRKGKWDRSVYRMICRKHNDLDLSCRECVSCREQMRANIYSFVSRRIHVKTQYRMKNVLKKLGFHFDL